MAVRILAAAVSPRSRQPSVHRGTADNAASIISCAERTDVPAAPARIPKYTDLSDKTSVVRSVFALYTYPINRL
jgi:hypothetical protein